MPGLSYFLSVCADDGTPPNFTSIWEYNSTAGVSCPLTTGSVCAKWTSYYEDTGNETTAVKSHPVS